MSRCEGVRKESSRRDKGTVGHGTSTALSGGGGKASPGKSTTVEVMVCVSINHVNGSVSCLLSSSGSLSEYV